MHLDNKTEIVINGRFRAHRITGIQRYAHEIATRIGGTVDILSPESGRGVKGHIWEQLQLPRACRGRLLWSPTGSGPISYRRQVVTIHDLFPIENPEWYSRVYSNWYKHLLEHQVAQAVHLIAVSEYTKTRIVERLGCDPERISVIPNGLTTGCQRVEETAMHKARTELKIPSSRYVLTLSSLEPRKNLRTILKSWALLHEWLPSDIWLVVAGAKADQAVYAENEISPDLPRVHFTGYVPDEHLAGLYSGASLFLFPSLAEGFGIPLLEAMACGVRCIASNAPSLQEVGGDAVVYVDALDTKGLTEAIAKEFQLGASRHRPYSPAIARAQRFSWDDAAEKTNNVLVAAANATSSRSVNSGTKIFITGSQPSVATVPRNSNVSVLRAHSQREQRKSESVPVALVHDWLTGMRGGEKVLEVFCRLYPDAELWTLLHVRGSVSRTIENRKIHTSLLQKLPCAEKRYRSYLPLFPIFAELAKTSSADLIISSSHAVAKAMVPRQRGYHICYIHTPMRYAWDMFDDYFGPDRVGALASRYFFRPVMQGLQFYDKGTSDRVDMFLANSHHVAERVRRIYGREAQVIAPPVDTARYSVLQRDPQEWYLVVSALVPYKRVDHTIRVCQRMGRRLCIVGTGPELDALRKLASDIGANVNFAGFVSDQDLGEYYRHARALFFPGVEDFGIVPVEAIACGCPVIALGAGGILDSMTPETSVLYTEPTIESLAEAITEFEARENKFSIATLRSRASCFSEELFVSRFSHIAEMALKGASSSPSSASVDPQLSC